MGELSLSDAELEDYILIDRPPTKERSEGLRENEPV